MGNIEYLSKEEQTKIVTSTATELRRLVDKWEGLELNFALRAAAKNIHLPLEDVIYGLKYGLSQKYLRIKNVEGDEESLLVAGDKRAEGRWA